MTPSLLDRARSGVPGVSWPPLVEGAAATVLALARQLEASQWYEPADLRALQVRQLGELMPWLAAHSPAFARRIDAAGLAAEDLAAPAGLAALPPVERRWFQTEPDIYSDAVPPQHEPCGMTLTSGSTGEVLRVRRTRAGQLVWLAMVLREHVWNRTDVSLPLATVRATNAAVARHDSWGPPVSLLFESGPALQLPINLSGDELFDRLAEFEAGNLVIYPNALGVLLDAAERRGARLASLRAIRTVGELVTPYLRERTQAVLGLTIADAYTCQEAGYLALQCPDSGLLHVMAESHLVEVLRPDGAPCEPGELGRVVITDMHNFATPVVRYALGDHAEVAPPCPCGRGLPTLARIVGRSRNLVLLPDGTRRWPSLGGFGRGGFLHSVPILQYQCVQTHAERIEVRLVTARALTTEEEQLVAARMVTALGYSFQLEFRYFEERLPLPLSGKFEDFICEV